MRTPDLPRFMVTCDLCGDEFQFGPHRYRGKWVGVYKMYSCSACYDTSWDGIAPIYESRFKAHLLKHGIALPARRVNDLYPRG
jgi:hypothetical protein